jgi:putative PIN family toxin of toxin-antitoxin system
VIRVVFDTNILLSAILFGGNPEKLIKLAWEKKIQILVSPAILMELVMVLRDKFHRDDKEAKKAVQMIGSLVDLLSRGIESASSTTIPTTESLNAPSKEKPIGSYQETAIS